jgi:hypothetical protein
MKHIFKFAALALALAFTPASAQMQAGLPSQPLGYCQAGTTAVNAGTTFSGCVGASFTGTCVGTTLTASAVTGDINVGWPLSGTGIVAGTFVSVAGTGTGGAGTYTTSQACTSSGAALTTVGPPNGATFVLLGADTQAIRWRDDGGAPTASVGMLLVANTQPVLYSGTMRNMQFIGATAGGLLNASFYKTSSP